MSFVQRSKNMMYVAYKTTQVLWRDLLNMLYDIESLGNITNEISNRVALLETAPAITTLGYNSYERVVVDSFPLRAGQGITTIGVSMRKFTPNTSTMTNPPHGFDWGADLSCFLWKISETGGIEKEGLTFISDTELSTYLVSNLGNDGTNFYNNTTVEIYYYIDRSRVDITRIFGKNYAFYNLKGSNYKDTRTTMDLCTPPMTVTNLLTWFNDFIDSGASPSDGDIMKLVYFSGNQYGFYKKIPITNDTMEAPQKGFYWDGVAVKQINMGNSMTLSVSMSSALKKQKFVASCPITGYAGTFTYVDTPHNNKNTIDPSVSLVVFSVMQTNAGGFFFIPKPIGQDTFEVGYISDFASKQVFVKVDNGITTPYYRNITGLITVNDDKGYGVSFTVTKEVLQPFIYPHGTSRKSTSQTDTATLYFVVTGGGGIFTTNRFRIVQRKVNSRWHYETFVEQY